MSRQVRTREGRVVRCKMDKTIVVEVERKVLETTFKKYIKRVNKVNVHDEKNLAKLGDLICMAESRPLSKQKNWVLQKILIKGEEI